MSRRRQEIFISRLMTPDASDLTTVMPEPTRGPQPRDPQQTTREATPPFADPVSFDLRMFETHQDRYGGQRSTVSKPETPEPD